MVEPQDRPARPGGGAGRRARTDERLAAAVRDLLTHTSYAALTIEKVAAASGVAKTTIYRRWASKAEMVLATVIHAPDPLADTGSLTGDVACLAARSVALMAREPARSAVPGLLADMAADPAVTQRLRTAFAVTSRQEVGVVVERALARGEVDEGADVEGFHAALLGIPFVGVHLQGRVDEGAMVADLTRQLLAILGVRGS